MYHPEKTIHLASTIPSIYHPPSKHIPSRNEKGHPSTIHIPSRYHPEKNKNIHVPSTCHPYTIHIPSWKTIHLPPTKPSIYHPPSIHIPSRKKTAIYHPERKKNIHLPSTYHPYTIHLASTKTIQGARLWYSWQGRHLALTSSCTSDFVQGPINPTWTVGEYRLI